jgi:hypothetical protein
MKIEIDNHVKAFLKHQFGIDEKKLQDGINSFEEYRKRPICFCDDYLDAYWCERSSICRPPIDGIEQVLGGKWDKNK